MTERCGIGGLVELSKIICRSSHTEQRVAYTPLEFVKKTLNAQLPRYPRRDGLIRECCELRVVTLQEDREAYDRLKEAIRETSPSTQAGWSIGKVSPAIHVFNVQDRFPVTLHGAISRTLALYRRLTANWHRFEQTVLTMDGALACLGFVLTVSAFFSLTAWDFAWWALEPRTSRFSQRCE